MKNINFPASWLSRLHGPWVCLHTDSACYLIQPCDKLSNLDCTSFCLITHCLLMPLWDTNLARLPLLGARTGTLPVERSPEPQTAAILIGLCTPAQSICCFPVNCGPKVRNFIPPKSLEILWALEPNLGVTNPGLFKNGAIRNYLNLRHVSVKLLKQVAGHFKGP